MEKWFIWLWVPLGILTVAVLLLHVCTCTLQTDLAHIPLSVFNFSLSFRVWMESGFALLFLVMEDAFHVGSQPQENTSYTPVPLRSWVIELWRDGCGGWEEARPVIGYRWPRYPALLPLTANVSRWMSIEKQKRLLWPFQGCVTIYVWCVVWTVCLPNQAKSNNCGYREYSPLDEALMSLCAFILSSFLNKTILPGWVLGRMWFRPMLFLDWVSKALSRLLISQQEHSFSHMSSRCLTSPTVKELVWRAYRSLATIENIHSFPTD